MATTVGTHDHRLQQTRLPPSPPPSPPQPRRRHRKKHSDPFFDLNEPPLSSPQPASPTSEPDAPQEPLFTRLILAPLYFISFLFSLFLVNRQDRARRAAHSSRSSVFSYLYPQSWLDPEPYQDPLDTTWGRRESVHVEPNQAIAPKSDSEIAGKAKKKRSWHLHKKIRQVAKLEISDAFEMRGRVMVFVVGVLVLGVAAICFGLGWVVRSLWW